MRTSKFHRGLAGLALLASSAIATPAFAQEEEAKPVTITGSVGRVRQGGVISAVAVGHRQAALAVMCRG